MKIGVLTSGGDAPGMNAAIRAVVRAGVNRGMKVIGIRKGFQGLLNAELVDLAPRSVSDTIHRGGTLLLTARCPNMMSREGQEKAAGICKILNLDALVVIGGDGSLKGCSALSALGVNTICIPATIDLDISCTEYSIGFDTAVNTGMEAINKIRDTSSSHERCSVVEVMGRESGAIAFWCSLTGGAEEALTVENRSKKEGAGDQENTALDYDRIVRAIVENRAKGKTHNLIVVAEGVGGSVNLAKHIEKVTGIQSRATILGHLQRGGAPTALDRMHASIMGHLAVEAICAGEKNRVIIFKEGRHGIISLEEALEMKRTYDCSMYDIMKTLSV